MIEIRKVRTEHGNTLVAILPGGNIGFWTLDDCFGMDRIRHWAKERGFEVPK